MNKYLYTLLSTIALLALIMGISGVTGFMGAEAAFANDNKAEQVYNDGVKELARLQSGDVLANRRDTWEKLAGVFETVPKISPAWRNVPAAHYRAAMSLHELARRSFRKEDYQAAVDKYAFVVNTYPKHVLADDALMAMAHISAERLADTAKAQQLCQRVVNEYPTGDQAAEARQMLEYMRAGKNTVDLTLAAQANAAATGKTDFRVATTGISIPVEKVHAEAVTNTIKPSVGAGVASAPAVTGTPAQVQPKPVVAPKPNTTPPATSPPATSPHTGQQPASRLAESTLYQISWEASQDKAVITLALSKQTAWEYKYLPADGVKGLPPRLAVTFKSTKADKSLLGGAKIAGSMFRSVGVTENQDKTCTIVLGFSALRRYNFSTVQDPNQGTFRIVIETARTDKDLPNGVLAGDKTAQATKPTAATPSRVGTTQAAAGVKPGHLASQLGLTVQTIVIDAGHGGKDPGTGHNGIVERVLTLKMAKLLESRLKQKGYTVYLTRSTDVFLPLDRRTEIANEKGADLFISVHVNASKNAKASGFETYYLDYAKSEQAGNVASRENASGGKRLSDLQGILAELIVSSKTVESRDLATVIQNKVVTGLRKRGFAIQDNGVRSAPFIVLIGTKMPAVLLELGYCSNTAEAGRLKSDKYLAAMADVIVDGVNAYKVKLANIK